ncbi:hypothetical protein BEN47_01665 [Hymenobacter lapidarius]|uniref:Secretion system C-terminal sorting domain-containing protein n=1 Tax=Hymenobacter lapidarius TaxID=1908237 RepID=A0A1G1T5Y2_9BACT|nr:hypothetical protein BEN47_01665 [Hymenobacter lapidarius]
MYIAGAFRGTVQFGSIALTSSASNDIEGFLAKWNSATGFAWAQRFGGGGSFSVRGLAVGVNAVYLVGSFRGTTSFGNISLTSTGGNDGFVAKLTDAGTDASFDWAKTAGGVADDDAQAVAVNGNSVYITGDFSGAQASFGTARLSSAGGQDLYVAKLTDTGASADFAWAQQAGGSGDDYSQAVAVSGANVYIAGSSNSTAAAFGGVTLTTTGLSDVIVAKLADAGATASFVWAQQAGGVRNDRAVAVEVSGSNVYVAGTFESSASFGSIALTNAAPAGSFATDAFVTKMTDAGTSATFTWARQAGGESDDFVTDMVLSGPSVYLVGRFNSETASFGNTALTNLGYNGVNPDIFVTKLTDAGSAGTFVWAQQAGGAFSDIATSVALSTTNLYVTGAVNPPARFGSQNITGLSTTATVAYLASFSTITGLSALSPALPDGLAVFPNPSHTSVTVQLPPIVGAARATLTVLDALGRAVHTQTVALPASERQLELNLAGFRAGLYAVQVSAGGKAATCRLVVE